MENNHNSSYLHIIDGKIVKINVPHPLEGKSNKKENAKIFLKDLNIDTNLLETIGTNNNLFKSSFKNKNFIFFIETNDGGGRNTYKEKNLKNPAIKCSIPYEKKEFRNIINSLENVLVISQYFPLITKVINGITSYHVDYDNCIYSIIEPKEIYYSKGFQDILLDQKANPSSRWVSLKELQKVIHEPNKLHKNKKNNVNLVHCSKILNFFEEAQILNQQVIILDKVKNDLSNNYSFFNSEQSNNFFKPQEEIKLKSINEYYEQIMRFNIPRNLFRKVVLNKSNKCEILTCNVDIQETLIASHIKAVNEIIDDKKIEDNEKINQIFDQYNGFTLCKNHDSLFDRHLISFTNEGKLIVRKDFENKVKQLGIEKDLKVLDKLSEKTKNYLDWHRNILKENDKNIF